MSTQSQSAAELSQLRTVMKSMSVVTLSSIDEYGVLLECSMSCWEMDDSGALWFFADPICPLSAYLPSINLSFADAARTRRVSLSGPAQIYAEDFSSEYLLGAIWLGCVNTPRFTAQTQLNTQALLKFTPQKAVYWQAHQSLMARLFTLLTAMVGGKFASVARAVHCAKLSSNEALDASKQAA